MNEARVLVYVESSNYTKSMNRLLFFILTVGAGTCFSHCKSPAALPKNAQLQFERGYYHDRPYVDEFYQTYHAQLTDWGEDL